MKTNIKRMKKIGSLFLALLLLIATLTSCSGKEFKAEDIPEVFENTDENFTSSIKDLTSKYGFEEMNEKAAEKGGTIFGNLKLNVFTEDTIPPINLDINATADVLKNEMGSNFKIDLGGIAQFDMEVFQKASDVFLKMDQLKDEYFYVDLKTLASDLNMTNEELGIDPETFQISQMKTLMELDEFKSFMKEAIKDTQEPALKNAKVEKLSDKEVERLSERKVDYYDIFIQKDDYIAFVEDVYGSFYDYVMQSESYVLSSLKTDFQNMYENREDFVESELDLDYPDDVEFIQPFILGLENGKVLRYFETQSDDTEFETLYMYFLGEKKNTDNIFFEIYAKDNPDKKLTGEYGIEKTDNEGKVNFNLGDGVDEVNLNSNINYKDDTYNFKIDIPYGNTETIYFSIDGRFKDVEKGKKYTMVFEPLELESGDQSITLDGELTYDTDISEIVFPDVNEAVEVLKLSDEEQEKLIYEIGQNIMENYGALLGY